jgi:hypothetical protein
MAALEVMVMTVRVVPLEDLAAPIITVVMAEALFT